MPRRHAIILTCQLYCFNNPMVERDYLGLLMQSQFQPFSVQDTSRFGCGQRECEDCASTTISLDVGLSIGVVFHAAENWVVYYRPCGS
jgi:hypothetical protein